MLNFDGDVDANADANVKCEHTLNVQLIDLEVKSLSLSLSKTDIIIY